LEFAQTWESKMDLFLQLQMYLNNSIIDSVLLPSYKILYNLASSDESLLEIILRHLETEHENFYYSLANSNDISYVSGPKKPCIKAHLPNYFEREKIHQHEDYYLFLRRLCEFALNRYFNDKVKIQIILNVLIFAFIEMIPSPGIHATFVELLESPFIYSHLPENKILDNYIYKVLTCEFQILENRDCFNFIRGLFPGYLSRITPEQKSEIIVSFQVLFSKRFQEVEDDLNGLNFSTDMISLLMAGNMLLLDDDLGQIVKSGEFYEFINRLKNRIPENANFSLEELRSVIEELEVQLANN